MKSTPANLPRPNSTQLSTSNPISVSDPQQPSNRRAALFIVLACFLFILLYATSGGSAHTPEWTPASINLNELPVHHQLGSVTEQTIKLEAPLPATPTMVDEATSNWFMDGLSSLFNPSSSASPAAINDKWVTIFSDDFEGTFPGEWTVFDDNGADAGEYYWNKSNCRAYEGNYSAWAVGGGAEGGALACGSNYSANASSRMLYGPFDLSDATDAEVNFKYWLYSESVFDKFYIVASIDGTNISGLYNSGNSNGWSEYTFDLTDAGSLGDLTGESQVWIGFIFVSDGSVDYAEGAYVDNVLLRKYVQDIPTDTPTSTPTRTSTPTSTATHTPTPPVEPGTGQIHLPLVINRYPITPIAPVLNAISNDDGDGSYTVSWSSVAGATSYLLQEDDNSAFSSPTTAYEGSATFKSISGKPVGTYYYRVRASNSYATSGWSNVRSVAVTAASPACPQTGRWMGTTSQGMNISFVVDNSPSCQIESGSLVVGWSTGWSPGCTGEGWTKINIPLDIVEGKFDYTDYSINAKLDELHGTFTSSDVADGTFEVEYTVYVPYTKTCSSGVVDWEAQPFYGLDGSVEAVHIQPDDGKILIGGNFRFVNGVERNYLARMNTDGSLDASFSADVDDSVYSITQQADGQILVGGYFVHVNGFEHKSIARLNPDGSLDNSFNTNISHPIEESLFPISSIIVLPDGDILVEGLFNKVDEQERNYVARLNPDGSLDDSFNANVQWAGGLGAEIVVHEDQIYIAGVFDVGDEYIPPKLARVNQDGSLDGSFTSYIYTGGSIGEIVIQPDGKIILSDGENILRLNDNGTTDNSFIAPTTNDRPLTMSIHTGGKIVVGGRFDLLDGQPFPYICQLNSNGTLNSTFKPEPNDTVYALAIQSDGKILVGGSFSEIGGAVLHKIARLYPDGSVDMTFNPNP